MSNYSQTTFFTPKDSLPLGNPSKVIYGAAYDVEFGNISTAIASKIDSASTGESVGNLTVTSSTVPVNGLYLPAANSVGISANTTNVATFKNGVIIGAPTGGDQGAGTINVTGLFINGFPIYQGAPVTSFGASNPTIALSAANTGFVSSASGLTITIPANASVPFTVGTMLTFENNGGGTMSIAITTDTLQLVNSATTGTRSLAANGLATAYKITTTKWIISGAGLT
jgi:hypothetical protein